MERLFQDLGGVLRLAAIPCEALLRCAAVTLSGFRVFFDVSCGEGHSAFPVSVWGCGCGSLSKSTGHMPPHVCDHGITAASWAPRTFGCLWSIIYGKQTSKQACLFPYCLLHTTSAERGRG
jgi:hypothetical protein